jgi:hypothetical protein
MADGGYNGRIPSKTHGSDEKTLALLFKRSAIPKVRVL